MDYLKNSIDTARLGFLETIERDLSNQYQMLQGIL